MTQQNRFFPNAAKKITKDGEATSAANTTQTVSTTPGRLKKLVQVTVKYSAAPTHSGITVTLNSGGGAAYDAELTASAANDQDFVYVPNPPITITQDDQVDVSAPAGGAGITSSVVIEVEEAA